ncbi:MAG: hypothetical protein PF488_04665 [Patescibacteria group bacterium]|jgi:glutaredoxin|nr:hypothetical protein [Patescibacteria group bacterium]
MKKFFKIASVALTLVLLFSSSFVNAETKNNDLNIYFFTGEGCPHCAAMREYLTEDLQANYENEDIRVFEFEVYKDRSNALLLKKAAKVLDAQVSGVPFLIIGDETFVGFSETNTPKTINERIDYCLENDYSDSVEGILLNGINVDSVNTTEIVEITELKENSENIEVNKNKTEGVNGDSEELINIPVLGEIDAKSFSLPLLTVVMGVLDGFNPCAMWVLLFLISLLLNIENRKRMWILGTTFIVASAFVYFLFMAAWLNLIMFLGLILWIRILIGLLALGGGAYSLRDYFVNKEAACKVSGGEKRTKTFDKLKKAVHQKNLWLALGGIVVLAFAVNLVELFCSAGLPAVYTQVLALNEVSSIGKYLYILLYIFFFMLDDLIIFIIAMTTLHITGISTKYSRLSRLIGGILMLIIGLMLIFRPEWLMFG